MRIALVSPVEPGQPGNGSAHRGAAWRRSLAALGDLTTIVVPVLGDSPTSDTDPDLGEMLIVPPMLLERPEFPWLARNAPEYLGARLADELVEFDLILAFKSYMAPLALGLGSPHATPVIVDLDDDDVAFYESRGQHVEADQHRRLLESIRDRARCLCSAQGFDDTIAIPNTYPTEVPLPETTTLERSSERVVMFANLTYRPNAEGAAWLIQEVWPEVVRRRSSAELIITGHGSDEFAHGTGFLDDIAPLYRSAAVSVAPIFCGSGTRVKILEAWAQGVPVVSTPLGVEGLGASHRQHALISSDPITFAEHIVALLTDPDLSSSMVSIGRQHVDRYFAPDVVAAKIGALISSVTNPPVGPIRHPYLIATEIENGIVVDDTEVDVVHHLDPVCAIVYSMSDGRASVGDLARALSDALDYPLARAERHLAMALDQLIDADLVVLGPEFDHMGFPTTSRRFRGRPGTNDLGVARYVYLGLEYDIPAALPAGTMVIDIGCHVGSFSARMVDSGADFIIALEPQPDNHRLANANLASEIEAGIVDLRREAIWSAPAGQRIVIGPAPMSRGDEEKHLVNTGGHAPHPASETTAPDEVVANSETIDALISELRNKSAVAPIWLKLDCEGGEWPTLETAEQLPEVDVIVAELHLNRGGSMARLQAVIGRLETFEFRVVVEGDPAQNSQVLIRAERQRTS